MRDWYSNLTRTQAGLLGGIIGYAVGISSGPLLRIIFYVLIIVAFGLIGKHVDAKIEASFGITGVVLAILVFTLLGPIQRWIGETAGNAIRDSSKFGLAIAGVFLALKIHSVSNIDDENENFTL
jgi:hypothetical protein